MACSHETPGLPALRLTAELSSHRSSKSSTRARSWVTSRRRARTSGHELPGAERLVEGFFAIFDGIDENHVGLQFEQHAKRAVAQPIFAIASRELLHSRKGGSAWRCRDRGAETVEVEQPPATRPTSFGPLKRPALLPTTNSPSLKKETTTRTKPRIRNVHRRNSFTGFLREEGLYEQVEAAALKKVSAAALNKQMDRRGMSVSAHAERLDTSRTAVGRVLDAQNTSITLNPLTTVMATGKEVLLSLRAKHPFARRVRRRLRSAPCHCSRCVVAAPFPLRLRPTPAARCPTHAGPNGKPRGQSVCSVAVRPRKARGCPARLTENPSYFA